MRYIKNGVLKFDLKTICVYLVVLDILLGPYLPGVSCLISMLIVYGWIAINFQMLKKRTSVWIGCMIILFVMLSIGMSYFMKGPAWLGTNITGGVLMCTYIAYYIFFEYQLTKSKYLISKIFEVYIWSAFGFSVLYLVNPQMYFNLRSIWSLSGTKITFYDAMYNRFTFIQSDPNSIGCVLSSMCLYILIFDHKMKATKKVMIAIATGCVASISLSTTSIVSYALCMGIVLVLEIKKRIKINFKIILLGVLLLVGGVFGISRINIKVDLFDLIVERVGGNLSGGTMSGRTIIWQSVIEDFEWIEYVLWGYGSSIVDPHGVSRAPHNGHFFVVLAYGLVAYILFMFLFFNKRKKISWKEYMIILPMFLLFSVNTLLIDFRACLVLPLISALFEMEVSQKEVENG